MKTGVRSCKIILPGHRFLDAAGKLNDIQFPGINDLICEMVPMPVLLKSIKLYF